MEQTRIICKKLTLMHDIICKDGISHPTFPVAQQWPGPEGAGRKRSDCNNVLQQECSRLWNRHVQSDKNDKMSNIQQH